MWIRDDNKDKDGTLLEEMVASSNQGGHITTEMFVLITEIQDGRHIQGHQVDQWMEIT